MANLLNMRLCGGTFLVLLFEARGQRRASRMSEGRPADGKSNPEIMTRLVRSVNPDFQMPSGRSFNTFTSDYKLCRTSDTPAAGLTDEQIVQQFDHTVKTKYYEHLGLFYGLLENSISWGTKGPWLIAALIDLIEADITIPSDALFYVRPYGQPRLKNQNSERLNVSVHLLFCLAFGTISSQKSMTIPWVWIPFPISLMTPVKARL